ncbi:hypothetical protein BC941DRAFT_490450 [Chlamydoabsidia padenii]|nr:hypothetical protein BC941DRAFT_490450 [Chlamydoabsidia padenii]
MTIPEYPLDLAILGSYFVLIGLLTWRISSQLSQTIESTCSPSSLKGRLVFLGLAGASFIATWSYMFAFFAHSYSTWKAYYGVEQTLSINLMSQWLHGVALFDDAWRTVCTGDWAWLWSIQLCSFTVAVWTPLIAMEGYRRQIPYVWAYMIFGQVVAISTSSALFFAVCLAYQQHNNNNTSSVTPSWALIGSLFISSIGGLITVQRTPQLTDSDDFLPNLLIMHGLLVLPLVYLATTTRTLSGKGSYAKSYTIIALYTIGSVANLYLISQQWTRTIMTVSTPQEILTQLFKTFLQHPAQSSISSDVVCVYVISIAWMLLNTSSPSLLVYSLVIFTLFLSPSVTLPIYLAVDEYRRLSLPHFNKTD